MSSVVVIDASSPETVLRYEGGRTPRHVPARDLSGHDLARIAYHRDLATLRGLRKNLVEPGQQRLLRDRPRRAEISAVEAIADELSGSGIFSRSEPSQEV